MDSFDQTSLSLFSNARAAADVGPEGFPTDLLAHYLPRLRAFVRARLGKRLRRRESASDIVQSVCRELVEKRGREEFELEGQFRAWVFTATLNKIRERARYWGAAKRNIDHLESLGDIHDLNALSLAYSNVLAPSRIAAARELLERLELALDALPEDDREVIALARIARLPHEEIAGRMDRSVGAVRQLLGRALRRLSKHLEEGDSSS